jgi:hypothetical protein
VALVAASGGSPAGRPAYKLKRIIRPPRPTPRFVVDRTDYGELLLVD